MMSLYELLGVRPGATPQEIKSGFRQGARDHHPDAAGSREAFERLRAAYETLIDPVLRQQYDAQRAEWLRQMGAVDCPACAKANRVKPNRHALCGHCNAPVKITIFQASSGGIIYGTTAVVLTVPTGSNHATSDVKLSVNRGDRIGASANAVWAPGGLTLRGRIVP